MAIALGVLLAVEKGWIKLPWAQQPKKSDPLLLQMSKQMTHLQDHFNDETTAELRKISTGVERGNKLQEEHIAISRTQDITLNTLSTRQEAIFDKIMK